MDAAFAHVGGLELSAGADICLIADDLAARSERALLARGAQLVGLNASELGKAAGFGRAGALILRAGPASELARYWCHVLLVAADTANTSDDARDNFDENGSASELVGAPQVCMGHSTR